MIKKIGLIALTSSMMLLSGCGSSSNTTTTETTTTEAVTPVFTSELVVGKTYTVIGNDRDTTLTFTETGINFVDNGDTGTVTYTIDASGRMIVDTPDGQFPYTLVSIEENGDLKVIENNRDQDMELTWVLI